MASVMSSKQYMPLNENGLDFTQRWIISDNWTYTADITPFLSTLSGKTQSTLLVFYGLDTVANIVSRIV